MTRALLILPLLASVALAALGWWAATHGPDPATTPVAAELASPPSALATPPLGARPGAWFLNTVHEARRDGVLFVIAGIFFVTSLVHLVSPRTVRRIRTSVLFLFAYLATMPACGLLVAGAQLEAYGWLRTLSVFCMAMNVTNLVSIFAFDVLLPSVRLSSRPILRDLLTGIAYIVVTVTVLSRAGVELKGILAGSAVLGAIIGLSIQSTLGDAFGGLILEWEDSIEVGEWIKVGDVVGKVKEIRWRHIRVETRNWETVLLPNSAVTKTQVTVLGKREGQPTQLRRWLYFTVGFERTPTEVIGIINSTLQAGPIERVAMEPKPNCVLMDFRETGAYYGVRYWLTDLQSTDSTDSLVRTRLYFALQRAGVAMAIPQRSVHMEVLDDAARTRQESADRQSRLGALRRFDLFRMLNEEEVARLVPHLSHARFARGEVMTRQGAEAHWLYLLVRGQATVQLALPDGAVNVVARLQAPDYFGEMALLTGERRTASVVADAECECWRLDRAVFKEVLQARPEIATELSRILAARKQGLQQAATDGTAAKSLADEQKALLRQITRFFGLTE